MRILQRIFVFVILLTMVVACGNKETKQGDTGSNGSEKKASVDSLIEANNAFAIDMMKNLRAEKENIFLSPTSLFLALSMTQNGATGKTHEEIVETLHLNGFAKEELNRENQQLLQQYADLPKETEMHIANSLWLNDEFTFTDQFAKDSETFYEAETRAIDTSNEKSVDEINTWTEDKTNEKITDIVEGPLDEQTIAYLINTIYFSSEWSNPFTEELTTNDIFHIDGRNKVEVPFMERTGSLDYFEDDLFEATRLYYGKDAQMSMDIYLPKEGVSLDELIDEWSVENEKLWNDSFEEETGTLRLPRFEYSYDIDLKEMLQTLGIEDAFNPEEADFTEMIQEDIPLWISNVKQKTFINVDEKGTEAAAATAVEIMTESAMPSTVEMEVNKPFLFMLRDTDTGQILFVGTVYEPEKS